jgi:hypothetical protein
MAATVPATIVLAQQAPAGDQAATEKSDVRRGPSPETIARLQDGRIAFAKAALKLNADQEKLWAPVEEKIRATFADHQKSREAWKAKHEERKANREDGKGEKLALPDRIEKRSQRMTERAQKLNEQAAKVKEYAEVLKPLYASFSEEQKAVASKVLGHLGVGGGGKGPRWAMHRGFGHGHGQGGDRGPDLE